MATFNFHDPFLFDLRSGKEGDEFISKTDTMKIINNEIHLNELPDEFSHVQIDGYFEIYKNSPLSNQFIVDYLNGIVTFNPSEEGKTIVANYMGRGIVRIPAERIYAQNKNNPSVVQNLQEIVDNNQTTIDTQAQLAQIKQDADTAVANANTATDNANSAADNANSKATLADQKATLADTATVSANTATTNANNAANSANSAATNANSIISELVHKGDWDSVTLYKINNIIDYNGSSYMAIADNSNIIPTDTINWKLMASKGDQGIQGIKGDKGINWRGVFDSLSVYIINDGVSYNGSSYICIQNTIAGSLPTNTTYWDVVAQKGTDGTGTGTVTNVSSTNSDISVSNGSTTPTLTLNTGTGGNQIVKLESDAKFSADLLKDGATNSTYTNTEKTKLSGIIDGATKTESSTTNGNVKINGTETNVYTHPTNHPATMITEDDTHRFVTDTEKTTWSGKQNALGFTPENSSNKGIANGYASLGSDGRVPSDQLPSIQSNLLTMPNAWIG